MSTTTAPTPRSGSLPLPATVDRRRIRWPYLGSVVGIHALALLALSPMLFRWTSVAAVPVGLYVFGTLGINLCYHRLLAHRAFRCGSRFEHFLALLGVCCLQDTPVHWVAAHRLHHQHSDQQPDPHSPLVGFFWSHLGWLWVENSELDRFETLPRFVKDLLRDRFYLKLEHKSFWLAINLAQWLFFFSVGAAIGWLSTGHLTETLWGGASMLVWGVFVRTVVVWHITWSVNSVTHLWGYRRYSTGESSRNNWLIGLLSNGEGWHNNHHAQPRAAAHGHRWWELDVTFLTVRLLALMGLVWDVIPVNSEQKAAD